MPNALHPACRLAASAALVAMLTGCAAVKLPAPTASFDTVQTLRGANVQPMKTGQFALAPGKAPDMDQVQGGLRGSSVSAESGSFSLYLKEVVTAELKAAGLYDASSAVVIDAQLTDSQLDAAIGTGTGRLAARFSVTRAGKKVYDKELVAESSWESSFVGAVALPAAINNYGALYQKLAAKLFQDAEFRAAVAK